VTPVATQSTAFATAPNRAIGYAVGTGSCTEREVGYTLTSMARDSQRAVQEGPMSGDKMKHKAEQALGKAKEKLGEKTGDSGLREEGRAEQSRSELKEAKDKAKDAKDQAKDAFRK